MKLDELHVGQHRSGARGHRNAVAGRFNGIGRVTIEPADAAGGKDDGAARGVPSVRRRRCRARTRRHSVAVDDEIVGRDVFDDLDRRACAHRVDERVENLVAGRIAAGFDDAPALVRGLAAERELARRRRDRTPRRARAVLRCVPVRRA